MKQSKDLEEEAKKFEKDRLSVLQYQSLSLRLLA